MYFSQQQKIYKNFFYKNIYKDDEESDNKDDDESYNDLCIGISLDVLKSCLKYALRKDSISISIKTCEGSIFPNKINFKLNNNKSFDIKFNIAQNINSDTNHKMNLLTIIPSEKSIYTKKLVVLKNGNRKDCIEIFFYSYRCC